MSAPVHLPPAELTDWLTKIETLLATEQRLDAQTDVATVLDLTRDIAHQVMRPAGPLTMFVLGLALGGSQDADEPLGPRLEEQAERVRELVEDHAANLPGNGRRQT